MNDLICGPRSEIKPLAQMGLFRPGVSDEDVDCLGRVLLAVGMVSFSCE